MSEIIGRDKELELLQEAYDSSKSEFIAIYGRRRVGKTYLIRNFFINKPGVFFHTTGLKDGSLVDQLSIFTASLNNTFANLTFTKPSTWVDAFELLNNAIKSLALQEKIIIFLDELPWMATPRSRLLQALDFFWNTQWVYQKNIKIVICGSAASWMLDNIVNSKGGLHNRLTKRIRLAPFSLHETKQYLFANNIKLNNEQILEIYMAIGGVPFYLNEVKSGYSATQNISRICFSTDALLYREFDNLLASLFKHSEIHKELLEILSKKPGGLNKNELVNIAKKSSSGGRFSKRLEELEAAGFIKQFIPYGKQSKDVFYQLIDEYTIFYLRWIKPNKNKIDESTDNIIWAQLRLESSYKAWSGYAFEAVCYKHISKIRHKLQLDRISVQIGNWRYVAKNKSQERGAQIDLIFDRNDRVISLCEIKYYNHELSFDKKMQQELLQKQQIFVEKTGCKKQIFWNLITAYPVKCNSYYDELIVHNVTLDDIF